SGSRMSGVADSARNRRELLLPAHTTAERPSNRPRAALDHWYILRWAAESAWEHSLYRPEISQPVHPEQCSRSSLRPHSRHETFQTLEGTPPKCPMTHCCDRGTPFLAAWKSLSSTITRLTTVCPRLLRSTAKRRTRSSCRGRPSSTRGLCVVSRTCLSCC